MFTLHLLALTGIGLIVSAITADTVASISQPACWERDAAASGPR